MAKRRWSLEEEKILVEVYFRREEDWPMFHMVDVAWEELHRHGYEREANKIRAKLYDISIVDRGLDISHVSTTTIKAYFDYPERPRNPLLDAECPIFLNAADSREPKVFLTNNFISSNPLFASGPVQVDISFTKMLEHLIDECEFHYRPQLKWSTIYTLAEVKHSTANEIRRGERLGRVDAKYNLLRLLFVMKIDYKTSCLVLSKANFSFNGSSMTDKLIAIAMNIREFNRKTLNEALVSENEEPLFPELHYRTHK